MNKDGKKYIIVLLITIGIFIVVFGLVNFMNNQKLAHVDDLQRKITADLIAAETQFELLKTAPCELLDDNVLSRELGEFGRKLDVAETNQGDDDADVLQLKKYYSLLQVKDYLLMEELSSKCETEIDSILYFYGDDCVDCSKQGIILTEFKREYPDIRIYSFDTDLDFSVIGTFTSLYDFGEQFPTLIVQDETYQGLQNLDDLEELFPNLVEMKEQEALVAEAKEFIQALEGYEEINIEDISLMREIDGVYEYAIAFDGREPDLVELVYDEDLEEFKQQEL
ncbi:MAG: hypothetical protein MRY57_02580 [Candidatus Pacebacteria bacterium]|nr:hypothetical protein [Candidatus Paceibacterota bacterium]